MIKRSVGEPADGSSINPLTFLYTLCTVGGLFYIFCPSTCFWGEGRKFILSPNPHIHVEEKKIKFTFFFFKKHQKKKKIFFFDEFLLDSSFLYKFRFFLNKKKQKTKTKTQLLTTDLLARLMMTNVVKRDM